MLQISSTKQKMIKALSYRVVSEIQDNHSESLLDTKTDEKHVKHTTETQSPRGVLQKMLLLKILQKPEECFC